ncbi:hypothetical protein V8B97DRAFT_2025598 [Scleroderma yunnanense]
MYLDVSFIGICTGSTLCKELASERQTDVAKLLDYFTTVIKYKVLNSAALVMLPDFAMLSQPLYNQALALKPQEFSWFNAVCPSFNVKSLNADELQALTAPFLKEQMRADYYTEGPGENDEGAGQVVPTLKSSFYLQHWTTEQTQLFHNADSQMFNIPLFLSGLLKHMLPQSPEDGASSLPLSSPPVDQESPVWGHAPMNVGAICHPCQPSLAVPHHSAPPSSPTAKPSQLSAQGHESMNTATTCHVHHSAAAPHSTPPSSPTPAVQHSCHSTPVPPHHKYAAHARHSCSPTLCPQHCHQQQPHKHHREYQEDESDDDAPAQGRAHHSVIEYRHHGYDEDDEDYHGHDCYVCY